MAVKLPWQRGFVASSSSQKFLLFVRYEKVWEGFFLDLLILIWLQLKIIAVTEWSILGWHILFFLKINIYLAVLGLT